MVSRMSAQSRACATPCRWMYKSNIVMVWSRFQGEELVYVVAVLLRCVCVQQSCITDSCNGLMCITLEANFE